MRKMVSVVDRAHAGRHDGPESQGARVRINSEMLQASNIGVTVEPDM